MPGFPASPSSPRPAPPSRNASPKDRRAEAEQSRFVVVAKPSFFTDAYVLEPGTSGNNVSTPHQSGFDPAGDLVIVTCIAPDDWTPSAAQCVASDYTSAANGAWRLTLNTDGTLSFQNSVAGVADTANANVVPVPGAGDGYALWLYWYRQSSDGTTDFKYAIAAPSVDPATLTWTNIQVNRAAQAGVLTVPTADVHIGGWTAGTLNPFAGKVFRVIAYHATAMATKVWDMNPGDWSSGSSWVSASTGETWTINGTASVVPAVGAAPSQTVTAQTVTGTWSAVAGTVTGGAISKTAQTATGTWSAVTATPTGGPVSLTAQIATGTWSAVAGVISGGAGGPQTITAQVATGTWSAITATPTGGAVSLTAQVAVATWTANPGTVTGGPVTRTAQIATGTWSAIAGAVTAGAVTKTAQVATGTWSAVAGTLSSGGQSVTAQIAIVTWSANPGVVTGGPTTITAQVAAAVWSAVAGTLLSGVPLVELGEAITGYNPGRIHGATPPTISGRNPGMTAAANPSPISGRAAGMTFGQNPAAIAARNSPQLVGSIA